MNRDPELALIRASMSCATLLERRTPPWRLDKRESTKSSLKYRRGKGEIIIVNHEGRGWWDPMSSAKGDIFALVQHLDPGLNFGETLKYLRRLAGILPQLAGAMPAARRDSAKPVSATASIAQRWRQRRPVRRRSRTFRYLNVERAIPDDIILAASAADILREGPRGSAWFAHKDPNCAITHVEIRGPSFKGSLKGGTKTLFRFCAGKRPPARLVLTEAPIDALSLAALEDLRDDTLYAATGGGAGPATIEAINSTLAAMAASRGARLCSATDADPASERYAARHRELAASANAAFERLRPPLPGSDWNDVLKAQGRPR